MSIVPVQKQQQQPPQQPVFYFTEPREITSLFTNPAHSRPFLDAWLSAIAVYLRKLAGNALSNRAWGMGEVYPAHIDRVIASPIWEHKIVFILVFLNSNVEARTKLRVADQEFFERDFQLQFKSFLWGRTRSDAQFGFAPGRVSDLTSSVLRIFIHDTINVYFLKGYDLK